MRYEEFAFSDDFQDALLKCLIAKPEQFGRVGEIMQPSFFHGQEAIEVCESLLDYEKQFGKYPNFTTFANYVFLRHEKRSPDQAKILKDYVVALAKIDISDWQYYQERAVRFAKERAVYMALREIGLAQNDPTSKIDPVKLMEQAVSIGDGLEDDGLELGRDGERLIREALNMSAGVHTGYKLLDDIWKTGWQPGWLITILAPPKRFKTTFCINLALNMVRNNDTDVFYYACEISQQLACMRSIYNLTSWTQSRLEDEGADNMVKAFQTKWSGTVKSRLWFKHFSAKQATVNDIKRHAKTIIAHYDLHPKAIFIDYAETVRPNIRNKDAPDWRQSADVYTDARAMGDELGAAIIMPDRCNKETVGRRIPSMKSFQGSFEKAGIVDVALGLCATSREHRLNQLRFFNFLNRHGPQYQHIRGTIDPEKYKIEVTELAEDVDDPDEEDDGRQRYKKKKNVEVFDENAED